MSTLRINSALCYGVTRKAGPNALITQPAGDAVSTWIGKLLTVARSEAVRATVMVVEFT